MCAWARCRVALCRYAQASRFYSPKSATSTTTSDELATAHCRTMAHHTIQTPITKLLGIKHPIILAGMNQASGPELAAAVSNAGGCARGACARGDC